MQVKHVEGMDLEQQTFGMPFYSEMLSFKNQNFCLH